MADGDAEPNGAGVLIDPREGDVEDDASSTKQRSMLSLAGSLLAEISLLKLVIAWSFLIVAPALAIGVAPLATTLFLRTAGGTLASLAGAWAAAVVVLLLAVGWFGGRRLARTVESGFWALHSLVVEPAYALAREGVRHFAERLLGAPKSETTRAVLLKLSGALGGLIVAALGLAAIAIAWPATRWVGQLADLTDPLRMLPAAAANCIVVLGTYLAGAAAVWAVADVTMPLPRDVDLHAAELGDRATIWRVAHLSDVHVVGERYGFRLESGRAGPRGNTAFHEALSRLDALHREAPLDLVLITGDMTDAGRSSEWAEFFDALAPYPELRARLLILPGNHDVNVVDRANPARFDLPISPGKRLRQMRALSAIAAVQGERVRVLDRHTGRLGGTLAEMLRPWRAEITAFADRGGLGRRARLGEVWEQAFPMIVPPATPEGLGVVLFDSNADSHFSFTNALGLVPAEDARGLDVAVAAYPQARWILALHHHVVEYPRPAKELSERIGTALVNGSWFVRRLAPLAGRAVVMHGHRHIDWVGDCGGLAIVSAPSPVMGSSDAASGYFYVHRLAAGDDGRLDLLRPQRIDVTQSASTPAGTGRET